MGLPENQLGQGEREVAHLRTHPKVLILPTALAIVVVVLAVVALVVMPATWQPWSLIVIVAAVLVAVFPLFLLPLLRWLTTTYTITNHRLITRRGILTRTGHDLPLRSISNVSYEKSLSDRVFGCGTLVFTTSAEAPVVLHDIPDAEELGVKVSELLSDDPRG
ncbi:PH domain-containing protein [Propionicicella superfundia]|uniref:PH domain-containing protein n=1 Tax=Propionicicella superfundia TaxID=348582 RepID=UPI0004018D7D|nr:PH domain-containing protein [Propionicicella superfundia]